MWVFKNRFVVLDLLCTHVWSVRASGNCVLRAVFGMNAIRPVNFRISEHCNLGLFYFPETFRHICTYSCIMRSYFDCDMDDHLITI